MDIAILSQVKSVDPEAQNLSLEAFQMILDS